MAELTIGATLRWRRGIPDAEGFWLVWFECDSEPCVRKVERYGERGSLRMLSAARMEPFGFPAADFHGLVAGIVPEPESRYV